MIKLSIICLHLAFIIAVYGSDFVLLRMRAGTAKETKDIMETI